MTGFSMIQALAIAIAARSEAADLARAGFSCARSHPSVRIAAQRRLAIGHSSSTAALRAVFPGDSAALEGGIPGLAASESVFSTLATCTPRPWRRCQLPNDVLFMHIVSAERLSPSVVVLRIGVAFQGSGSALSSQTMRLRLESTNAGWQVTKFISGSVG